MTKADRPGQGDAPDIQTRAFEFAKRVVKLCQALDTDGVARVMMGQVLRSGTSIGANVEEAQGAQSRRDFVSKMSIARKEAYETRYWLRLIVETGLQPSARMRTIAPECDEITRILSAIILSARRRSDG